MVHRMSGLERVRLKAERREASALLAVSSPSVLGDLGVDAAWWTCHDEGDVGGMVSLVCVNGDAWTVRAIDLAAVSAGSSDAERTDAEALARIGDTVFVFGSSFTGKSGSFDERRAFVARFSEAAAIAGSASAEVLDVGTILVDRVSAALASADLLRAGGDEVVINIEGAAFVGLDLVLGLRWPVSADGQPLLVRLTNAVAVFSDPSWSSTMLGELDTAPVVVDVGASVKRPAGVRGMALVDETIHLLTGQTERELAAKKVKAAPALHVSVDGSLARRRASSVEIQSFEGFRKVEGLAPMAEGRWLYALDDEDAIVLVVGDD